MSAGRPWRITATAAPGTPAWLYSAKSRSIALVSAAEMTLGGGSALAESCQVASAIMAARTTTPTVVALRASSLQAVFLLSRQYLASLLLSGEFSGLATGDSASGCNHPLKVSFTNSACMSFGLALPFGAAHHLEPLELLRGGNVMKS